MEEKKAFGKIRSILFPIYKSELKKFIPLTLIFFCISFNYSALRNLKDLFLVDGIGAETLYYVKILGVTPMVIMYTLIYNSLSNSLGRDRLFYLTISYFLAFFAIFTFFIYPNAGALTLNNFYNAAIAFSPRFLGLWGAIKYWYFSLFYIHAELWGTFAISIVLWTFINEITNVKQAKRFYSFLAIGANLALIFSAGFLSIFSNRESLIYLIYIVLGLGITVLALYRWFTAKIAANPEAYEIEVKKAKKSKPKLSFMESMKFLFGSRYLRLIATLVFSYGFFISLTEAVWKSQMKALQKASGGSMEVLAKMYSYEVFLIGITAILLILFASSWIMNKGWKLGAMITPVVASVLGAIFFSFMVLGKQLSFFQSAFGVSSLFLAVVIGMLQVVLIKSFKYVFFDPTKESAYIPLDAESKLKGKAAVDGVGGRLGKSGGSALLTFVLIPYLGGGTIDGAVPYIMVMLVLTLFFWLKAVNALNTEFTKANDGEL